MSAKITAEQLGRRAVVYVRQSSPTQVAENLESQRRQYGLADRARAMGFPEVEVIDDDLGRSGAAAGVRPGFERLVADMCRGRVGAVFCLEASRLARNGRDWHHLLDLCGLAGAVIIDPEGVYDPRLSNDRLLLGLKGTMSEFELSLLRQRSHEAREAKARRGELGFRLPVGLCWGPSGKIEVDPDRRVQEAIGLIFRKFIEYGSARQVLLWLRSEKLQVPAMRLGIQGCETHWRSPTNASVVSILKNPLYAGAYVHGRHEMRTVFVDGRARKTANHLKPMERWTVLIRDHHPGYITWQQYERHQAMLAENAHMKQRMGRKAGRGGRALLTGLLRCGRCGRRLLVWYRSSAVRYCCRAGNVNQGLVRCLSFGSRQAEAAVVAELVRAVQGSAVDAALAAVEQRGAREAERVRALELELEQARYQASLAARRYDAVDPDNRLVAASLEARWNEALEHVQEVERKLERSGADNTPSPDPALLRALANDLQAVWDAPVTDMRLKQRIVRTLIEEIVVDVDDEKSELRLVLHWAGGRHTELSVPKKARPRTVTDMRAVEIVRGMAGRFSDEVIASTLNRLGFRTGTGQVWKAHRVQSLRRYHDLPGYDEKSPARSGVLTAQQAARRLGVTPGVVRRLISIGILKARQVVALAPWEIDERELETPAVSEAIARVRGSRPRTTSAPNQLSIIPTE